MGQRRKHRFALHRRRGRRVTPGAPPGQLVPEQGVAPAVVHAVAYGPDHVEERAIDPHADADWLRSHAERPGVIWVDVRGGRDLDAVRGIGGIFGLHPLALEDIVNLGQRPKVDPYDEHLFIVVRVPSPDLGVSSEQVVIVLGRDFVITFQERPDPDFDAVLVRLRNGKGRIRALGADYLAYALLDAAVDAYFPSLEAIGEHLEALEQQVIEAPRPALASEIHGLRAELLAMRRDIWPQREALSSLLRDAGDFIDPTTQVFLRDVYDHNSQLIDFVQSYREVCSDLMSVYLSSVSNRMNEVMKVLTVIATIFMPLGFIAGVYGMNFDRGASRWNMPELGWAFGYPAALCLMAAVAVGLLLYFRRRGWL